jgi:hypothetical protein
VLAAALNRVAGMASKKPSKEAGDDPSKDKEHQTLDEGDIKLLQSYASTKATARERGAESIAGALHLGHGVPCACHLSPQRGRQTRVRCWGSSAARAPLHEQLTALATPLVPHGLCLCRALGRTMPLSRS